MSFFSINLAEFRKNYTLGQLLESEINQDPIAQFQLWLQQAIDHKLLEPNAMILATVDSKQQVSQRTVLLKHVDQDGFVFFTHFLSRKGLAINENSKVSLLFLWLPLQRQVIVEGHVDKVSAEYAAHYFSKRPRASQIGAWASKQSQVIENRESMEKELKAVENRFYNKTIPMPETWGGFVIKPSRMEFWQGRESRMHDRIVYQATSEEPFWSITRLYP